MSENKKQVDDMPAHAIATMKETLDLCAVVFPNTKQEDLRRTFVDSYFNQ